MVICYQLLVICFERPFFERLPARGPVNYNQ